MSIIDQIEVLRDAGMTTHEVAAKLNISRSTLHRLHRKRYLPQDNIMEMIDLTEMSVKHVELLARHHPDGYEDQPVRAAKPLVPRPWA